MNEAITTVVTELTYHEKLLGIGITLLEEFKGPKIHHLMQCNVCNHKWSSTPTSKMQSFRKNNTNGCPNCLHLKKQKDLLVIRQKVLDGLTARGIVCISEYKGIQSSPDLIHVKNINCGHDFWITPTNLIHNGVNCSVCGIIHRVELLQQFNYGDK